MEEKKSVPVQKDCRAYCQEESIFKGKNVTSSSLPRHQNRGLYNPSACPLSESPEGSREKPDNGTEGKDERSQSKPEGAWVAERASQTNAFQVAGEGGLRGLGALAAGKLGSETVPQLPVEEETHHGVDAGLRECQPHRGCQGAGYEWKREDHLLLGNQHPPHPCYHGDDESWADGITSSC